MLSYEVMVVLTFSVVAIFLRRLNERYSADRSSEGTIRRSRVRIVYFTQNSQTPHYKGHTLRIPWALRDKLTASLHTADKSERPSFRLKINEFI